MCVCRKALVRLPKCGRLYIWFRFEPAVPGSCEACTSLYAQRGEGLCAQTMVGTRWTSHKIRCCRSGTHHCKTARSVPRVIPLSARGAARVPLSCQQTKRSAATGPRASRTANTACAALPIAEPVGGNGAMPSVAARAPVLARRSAACKPSLAKETSAVIPDQPRASSVLERWAV